jgi:hypothetical protein
VAVGTILLFLRTPCSFGLSAISQQYFSLTTNRPNLCGIELCIYKLNSLFVWLMAGAGLFREKITAAWLLMADLFREKKYCWLTADKSLRWNND